MLLIHIILRKESSTIRLSSRNRRRPIDLFAPADSTCQCNATVLHEYPCKLISFAWRYEESFICSSHKRDYTLKRCRPNFLPSWTRTKGKRAASHVCTPVSHPRKSFWIRANSGAGWEILHDEASLSSASRSQGAHGVRGRASAGGKETSSA